MKKMAWITGALTCLMVLAAALGCVWATAGGMAADARFYSEASREAVGRALGGADEAAVTAYIGLTGAEQAAFAQETAAFMKGETDALPAVLNEREQQHMRDVRALVTAAANMGRACLTLAAALAVATAWTGAKVKKRGLAGLAGGLVAVSVIMLAVMRVTQGLADGGFEAMFVQMHELLFTNDLWMLDPETDVLIRMMPQPLFEQALLNGANRALRMFLIVWAMLLAVQATVSGMIRRHMGGGEKR